MKNKTIGAIIATFTFVFIGCGGSGSDGVVNEIFGEKNCTQVEKNEYLYNYLKDWYLWNDEIPNISDFSKYPTMQSLIDAIKPQKDRWSFILNAQQESEFLTSKQEGMGVLWRLNEAKNRLLVLFTIKDSPVYKARLQRGDEVISINNIEIANNVQKIQNELDTAKNFKIKFVRNDITREISLKADTFTMHPIVHSSIVQRGDKKIGYIVYYTFNKESLQDFMSVLSGFKQEDVNEIIIDLRYNGGGYLKYVLDIGGMLVNDISGKVAFELKYNDRHSNSNFIERFTNPMPLISFNFDKIVFLTTKETASASEVLINSLKPFVNVYLIGNDTEGKSVGMQRRKICDKYAYIINFRNYNSQNETFSFDGIKANCYVDEGRIYPFGTTNDAMFNAGINYIQNGTCSGSLTRNARSLRGLGNKIYIDGQENINSMIKE